MLTWNLAIYIINRRPNYSLIENNCQNFVKFLLEVVCPKAQIPNTIENILARLQHMRELTCAQQRLPGTYPKSGSSGTGYASIITASGTWMTASGDTWV